MKEYFLEVPIKSASGYQSFKVRAISEAEALAKFKSEGGEWTHEDIEVTSLGEPVVVAINEAK
jgi:hypothetical protein